MMSAVQVSKIIAEKIKNKELEKEAALNDVARRLDKEYQRQCLIEKVEYENFESNKDRAAYIVGLVRSEFGELGFDKWESLGVIVSGFVEGRLDFEQIKKKAVDVVISVCFPDRVELTAEKKAG